MPFDPNYGVVVSIDPEFAEAYFYLGEHYEKLEDYERAKMCFEQTLSSKNSHELADEARAKLQAPRSKAELNSTRENSRSSTRS